MKENRTFDNYFGKFPGANGATMAGRATAAPFRSSRSSTSMDRRPRPLHGGDLAYNDGGMNCFELSRPDPPDRRQAPRLATRGTRATSPTRSPTRPTSRTTGFWRRPTRLADNFFSSMLGPSFPNHLYTIAATSGGVLRHPLPGRGQRPRRPRSARARRPRAAPSRARAASSPPTCRRSPGSRGVWGCDGESDVDGAHARPGGRTSRTSTPAWTSPRSATSCRPPA